MNHLRAALFGIYVPRHREASLQDLLRIVYGSLQQLLEVLILWHVLVFQRSPLRYCLQTITTHS